MTAANRSESVSVADTTEARVDDIVQQRAKAIAESEIKAGLVIGLQLSSPQENLFQIRIAFWEVDLVVDELEEAANLNR